MADDSGLMTGPEDGVAPPLHPRTKPLSRWVTALSFGFNTDMGTPTAFALSLLACAIWISLIPVEGFGKWDLTAGLVGNDIESTVEWFFGIAVLIVGVSVAARQQQQESVQHHQTDQMAQTLTRVSQVEDTLLAELTATKAELTSNTELTQQVHDLTQQVHALITGAAAPSGG